MQEKLLQELLTTAAQLYSQGDLLGAEETVLRVLTVAPTHAKALNLRGLIKHMGGDSASAMTLISAAIESDPLDATFFANLCSILALQGDTKKAVEVGTRAIELDGSNPIHREALANVLVADHRYEEALLHLEKSFEMRATALNTLTQGLVCARKVGDFKAAQVWLERIAHFFSSITTDSLRHIPSADLINLAYADVISPLPLGVLSSVTAELESRYRTLSTTRVGQVPSLSTSSQRIKLGYLSQSFGDNPIGHVTHQLFRHHDRTRFEVHLFSLRNREEESAPFVRTIREGCDVFHDVSSLSPRHAAQAIEHASLDILIYLDGFMSLSGPAIMAQRPAPRQYFWLGHAGTLGLSCIDATIADSVVMPHSERQPDNSILDVTGCYHCASPYHHVDFHDSILQRSQIHLQSKWSLPSLPFVFCGFNNPEKIDEQVFSAWMQILKAVPSSVLWLSNQFSSSALERNIRASAEAQGVHGERLIFAGRLPAKEEHLGRHAQADLFLDTFSHTASTTALDALWMGLPIITLRGSRFSSRICSDFLTNLNLSELICSSPAEYVKKAVALAHDPATCRSLKTKVAAAVKSSELFKPEQFARKLEAAISLN